VFFFFERGFSLQNKHITRKAHYELIFAQHRKQNALKKRTNINRASTQTNSADKNEYMLLHRYYSFLAKETGDE